MNRYNPKIYLALFNDSLYALLRNKNNLSRAMWQQGLSMRLEPTKQFAVCGAMTCRQVHAYLSKFYGRIFFKNLTHS